MKSILVLSLALFSFNSFATGGFDCELKLSPTLTANISGTTGRVVGNPLVGPLYITKDNYETVSEISRDLVVGYYNYNSELKILALNEDVSETVVEIDYNSRYKKGSAKIFLDGINYRTHAIKCEFE